MTIFAVFPCMIRHIIFTVVYIVHIKMSLDFVCKKKNDISVLACIITHFYPPLRFCNQVPTCAIRETASLGIMGEPRVPPLNPSETIVFSEHYRLWRV